MMPGSWSYKAVILWMAAMVLAVAGCEARRSSPSEPPAWSSETGQQPEKGQHPEKAQQVAAEMARNMKELEEELVSFLLASGPEVEALASRIEEAEDRFGWAYPLYLLDSEGEVRFRPQEAVSEGRGTQQEKQAQRRFTNLLRRARAQASIEGAAGQLSLVNGRHPTRRFSVSGPRQGIHILLNLEPERLWATYHLKPSVVVRILSSVPGIMAEDIGGVLRLIDPKGRVVYASRPYGEIEVVAQVAAIETAPQWAVEVLWPKEQGRAETAGSPGLVSLSLGVGVLLVALLWLLLSARKKESSRDLSPRNPQAADFPASVPIATENESEAEQFQIGDAIVDLDRHLVVRGEAEHPLTVREVDLLRLMMAAPNQVIHRQRMLDEAWGYSAEVTSRTVDTFVYRLRQKIEPDPQAPRHFLTVRGAGYRFVP